MEVTKYKYFKALAIVLVGLLSFFLFFIGKAEKTSQGTNKFASQGAVSQQGQVSYEEVVFKAEIPACNPAEILNWNGKKFTCKSLELSGELPEFEPTFFTQKGNVVSLKHGDLEDGKLCLFSKEQGFICNVSKQPQRLSLTGTTLSISGGNSVDLSQLRDVYTASSGLKLSGRSFFIDAPLCSSNQALTWTGTGFACVNLPNLNQTLSYDTATYTLSISDGNTVDLSNLSDIYHAGDGLSLSSDTFAVDAPVCTGTDKLQWNGSAFVCSADQDTTYSAGTGLQLTGTTFSLDAGIDLLTDVDTTTNAPTVGQVLKWNGTNWVPENDSDVQQLSISGHTISLTNGGSVTVPDNDTLAGLSCLSGQVAKWNGSTWACADDNDTGTTYSAGNGLVLSGTTFSVDAPTCNTGEVLTWNGSAFACSADQNTEYTAAGSLLQLVGTTFSLKEGTLTDGYLCSYSSSAGLVCNTDPASLGGGSGGAQTLAWDPNTDELSISGGNSVSLSDLTQSLTLVGTTLSISSGNSVDFSGWDTDVSDDVSSLGDLSDVDLTGLASGKVLGFDGVKWVPVDVSSTGGSGGSGSGNFSVETDVLAASSVDISHGLNSTNVLVQAWYLNNSGAWIDVNTAGDAYPGVSGERLTYEVPIEIDATNVIEGLDNYQIKVTLDTSALISAGKMRSDCGDIRFADSNKRLGLSYWIEGGCNTTSTTIWVKVPYVSKGGKTYIYMFYGNPNLTSQSNIDSVFYHGLYAEYYAGTNFNVYLGGCVDTNINHGWPDGTLINIPGCPNTREDTVSIRWSGWVLSKGSGNHTFYVSTDDGSRLYVDNTLIIDRWLAQGETEYSGSYSFSGMVPIKYEWFEGAVDAAARLGWAPADGSGKVYPIPSTYLLSRKITPVEPTISMGAEKPVRGVYYEIVDANTVRVYNNTDQDLHVRVVINAGTASGNFVSLAPSSADTDSSSNNSIFVNKTGTGNLVLLQNNGLDVFRIGTTGDSFIAGKLGIGQSTPLAKLDIKGSASDTLLSLSSGVTKLSALTGWQYRRKLIVNNTNSGSLQDFQVVFRLDTAALIGANKLNVDCSDLRVTAEDGVTVLPMWVEEGSCNTADTKVWVKVPTLASGKTLLYVYYGNSSATSVSDGNTVFDFFDDFNSTTLDTSKWTVETYDPDAYYSLNGDELTLGATDNVDWWEGGIENYFIIYTSYIQGDIFEAYVSSSNIISNLNSHGGIAPYYDKDNVYFWGPYTSSYVEGGNLLFNIDGIRRDVGTQRFYVLGDSQPHVFSVLQTKEYTIFSLDREFKYRENIFSLARPWDKVGLTIKDWANYGATISFKWALMRKYAPNMPSVNVGSEETDFNVEEPEQTIMIVKEGKVGVRTDTPRYAFQVGDPGSNDYPVANAWLTFSDKRFKEKIKQIDPKYALNKLLELTGVRFSWKQSQRDDIGFIAQDVQKVLPQAVYKLSDGVLAVDYSKIVPVIIEGIKQIEVRLSKLEEQSVPQYKSGEAILKAGHNILKVRGVKSIDTYNVFITIYDEKFMSLYSVVKLKDGFKVIFKDKPDHDVKIGWVLVPITEKD